MPKLTPASGTNQVKSDTKYYNGRIEFSKAQHKYYSESTAESRAETYQPWLQGRTRITEENYYKSKDVTLEQVSKHTLELLVNTLKEEVNKNFAIMHCVGEYPTDLKNLQLNQIDLFQEEKEIDDTYLEKIDDWNTDTKLSKEFETLGFFISDHPLNQYKTIFNQYNIINYENFEINKDILSSNVACTVLKIQEKKTQKGNSYAIVKFSDLSGVFELFIFSDIFEMNRELLVEGNSLMVTLIKNYLDENKAKKKINVKKIVSLKEVLNKPIKELKIQINNIDELNKFKSLSKKKGGTKLTIEIAEGKKTYIFQLNERRNLDQKLINSLKIGENILIN